MKLIKNWFHTWAFGYTKKQRVVMVCFGRVAVPDANMSWSSQLFCFLPLLQLMAYWQWRTLENFKMIEWIRMMTKRRHYAPYCLTLTWFFKVHREQVLFGYCTAFIYTLVILKGLFSVLKIIATSSVKDVILQTPFSTSTTATFTEG